MLKSRADGLINLSVQLYAIIGRTETYSQMSTECSNRLYMSKGQDKLCEVESSLLYFLTVASQLV